MKRDLRKEVDNIIRNIMGAQALLSEISQINPQTGLKPNKEDALPPQILVQYRGEASNLWQALESVRQIALKFRKKWTR